MLTRRHLRSVWDVGREGRRCDVDTRDGVRLNHIHGLAYPLEGNLQDTISLEC